MIGPTIVGGLSNVSKMPGYSYNLQALRTCGVGSRLAETPGTPCFYCYAKDNFYAFPGTIAAQERRLDLLQEALSNEAFGDRWSGALGGWLADTEWGARRKLDKLGQPRPESVAVYYADQKAQAMTNAGARRIIKGKSKPEDENKRSQELAAAALAARKKCEDLKADDPAEAKRLAAYIAHQNASYFRWHDSGDVISLAHLLLIDRVVRLSPDVNHWLPTQERSIVKAYRKHLSASGLEIPANLTIRISSAKLDAHTMPKDSSVLASSVSTNGETPGNLCPAYTQGGICGDCRGCWGKLPLWTYPVH